MMATIEERGNGFPCVGDEVYDSESNTVYVITELRGQIQTGRAPGCANWIRATIEDTGRDPTDYDEEEWAGVSDCAVIVEGD